MLNVKHFLAISLLVATSALVADHMSEHTIDQRTAPVSKVNVAKAVVAAPANAGPRSGESIVNSFCIACHGTGMANAPKVADAAVWGTVMEPGMDVVLASAKKGKNVMPAMGLCMDCSDEELISAINYLVNGK